MIYFMEERSWRRRDLDRGKTLAILLVVFGHLVARNDPAGPGWGAAWYEPLRAAVYSFHIPFLFYLSGYAAHWSGASSARGAGYWSLLGRRANRLLLPALIFGLAILCGKLAMMDVLHVDHAPASFRTGLADLLWHTDDSPAQSVWYLIVLFVYAAATPLLRPWLPRHAITLVLVAAPLVLLPYPPVLYLDRIGTYAPFFIAGLAAAEYDAVWCRLLDSWRLPFALLFACLLLLDLRYGPQTPRCLAMLSVSIVAIPAMHAMVRRLPPMVIRLLDCVTPYAFAIYLLNTVFIGLAKALLMTQLPWDAVWFPLFAVVLMGAGIAGPVVTKRLLFRPVRALDRLTS
jgi:peptidoglycan/LPS O-acetylase OafA/YrhL